MAKWMELHNNEENEILINMDNIVAVRIEVITISGNFTTAIDTVDKKAIFVYIL